MTQYAKKNKFSGSVVTVSTILLSVGFGRFAEKNPGFRFSFGSHDTRVLNLLLSTVVQYD